MWTRDRLTRGGVNAANAGQRIVADHLLNFSRPPRSPDAGSSMGSPAHEAESSVSFSDEVEALGV